MKFLERYISWQAQKPVKRSLLHTYLISLMSLCLCVCMLLGTTMAWFTSGVEVQNNEIYVGTLDVDLKMGGKSLRHVETLSEEEQPKVFDQDTFWFPGHVETRTFTVENKGEIRFTYKLSFTADPDEVVETSLLYAGEMAEEALVAAFLDSFLVYNMIGENVDLEHVNLLNTAEWECIGTLAQICEGGVTVFSGDSEMMAVPQPEGNEPQPQAQQEPVYPTAEHTIAVQMKEDAADDFQGFRLNFNVKLVANQIGTPEQVANEEQLIAALTGGRSVVLMNDLDLTQNIVLNNTMLNGDGKKLNVPESTGYDCAITTTGGTIRNLTILGVGGYQAIGSGHSGNNVQTQNLYIDNVKIDSVLYALYGKGDGQCKVVVTKSELHGGIHYDNVTGMDFVECTISDSTGADALMTICGNASFTGCTFEDFNLSLGDIQDNVTVTFTGCEIYADGQEPQALTADHVKVMLDLNKVPSLLEKLTIVIDGEAVSAASWIPTT